MHNIVLIEEPKQLATVDSMSPGVARTGTAMTFVDGRFHEVVDVKDKPLQITLDEEGRRTNVRIRHYDDGIQVLPEANVICVWEAAAMYYLTEHRLRDRYERALEAVIDPQPVRLVGHNKTQAVTAVTLRRDVSAKALSNLRSAAANSQVNLRICSSSDIPALVEFVNMPVIAAASAHGQQVAIAWASASKQRLHLSSAILGTTPDHAAAFNSSRRTAYADGIRTIIEWVNSGAAQMPDELVSAIFATNQTLGTIPDFETLSQHSFTRNICNAYGQIAELSSLSEPIGITQ